MQDRIIEFLVPYLTQYGYPTLLLLTFLETSAFLAFAWEQAHDCATAAAARDLRAAS